jgi:hypothetical protein
MRRIRMNDIQSSKKKANGAVLGLMTIFVIVLVATIVLFTKLTTTSAAPGDLSSAEAQFLVMVGSRIDTCSLCHLGSPPALNSFGADYKSHGRNAAALVAIENLDSDGDGFTNLQEIQALTFPGDATDHPVAASPTPTSAPTQVPPTATKVPPTATKVPPTSAPTNTGVPTQGPTSTVAPTQGPANTTAPTMAATNTRPAVSRTPTVAGTRRVTRTPRPTHQPSPTAACRNREDDSRSSCKTPRATHTLGPTPTLNCDFTNNDGSCDDFSESLGAFNGVSYSNLDMFFVPFKQMAGAYAGGKAGK